MSKSLQVMEGRLAPLNAQAGKVMRHGITFEPTKYLPHHFVDQNTAPQICPVDDIPDHLRPLIGFSYARMTVVGLCPERVTNGQGQWVVRCRCGMFTIRQFTAIIGLENRHDCCARCRAVLEIRRNELRRRLGRRVHLDELPGACPPRGPLPAGVVMTAKQNRHLQMLERQKKARQEKLRKQAEIDKKNSESYSLRRRGSFPPPDAAPSAMSVAFAGAKKQR